VKNAVGRKKGPQADQGHPDRDPRRRQWTVSSGTLVMQSRPGYQEGISRNPDSFEIEACEVEFEAQYFTRKFNAEA
jgi:hypothetical protein